MPTQLHLLVRAISMPLCWLRQERRGKCHFIHDSESNNNAHPLSRFTRRSYDRRRPKHLPASRIKSFACLHKHFLSSCSYSLPYTLPQGNLLPAGMVLMPHYSHPSNPLQIAEQTAFVFRRWMDDTQRSHRSDLA